MQFIKCIISGPKEAANDEIGSCIVCNSRAKRRPRPAILKHILYHCQRVFRICLAEGWTSKLMLAGADLYGLLEARSCV